MESGLTVPFSGLLLEVAAFLGYGSVPASWSAEQEAEATRFVQTGVRNFYYPPAAEGVEAGYPWSFLRPTTTLATTADDQAQDLPPEFARLVGDFYYAATVYKASIVSVSEHLYQARIASSTSTGKPQLARIRAKPQVTGQPQRLEVAWWPIPDDAYTLTYEYEAYAGPLSSERPYALGGMRHAELLTESCLAVAEQRANDEVGLHTERFERLLKAAVERDRSLGAQLYGPMGEQDAKPRPRHGDNGSTYQIQYKGETL